MEYTHEEQTFTWNGLRVRRLETGDWEHYDPDRTPRYRWNKFYPTQPLDIAVLKQLKYEWSMPGHGCLISELEKAQT